MFKLKPAFTIEWEYGPNRPCRTLKLYTWGGWSPFGFIFDAAGHIVGSLLWFKGRMR